MVHWVTRQDEATRPREPAPEARRVCATGHRCGHPASAHARHTARPRVTPAIGAPGLAAFPVMCGARVADARVGRGAQDTSDNNPDRRAAIWYTPPGRVWACRRAVDTCQMQPVMPREAGASGVLLNYAILPYDRIDRKSKRRWQNTLVTKFCPGV